MGVSHNMWNNSNTFYYISGKMFPFYLTKPFDESYWNIWNTLSELKIESIPDLL